LGLGHNNSEAVRGNEDEFSEQLREVERNAAKNIVKSRKQGESIAFRILNNARALAEMAYESNRTKGLPPVACKAGCSWCCSQLVRISATEAVSITNHLQKMKDAAKRDAIIERLRRLDAKSRGSTVEERDALHTPCAFLTEASCEIYETRPMACSWYTSWYLEECKERSRVGVNHAEVHMDRARTIVYSAVRDGTEEGLSEAIPGMDKTDLELTAAVVDALEWDDPEAEWLSGNPIFAKAHISERD
jgi:Fe-S-cluster containining protein